MIPEGVRALLAALRFDGRSRSPGAVDRETLDFADRAQLTPLFTRFDLPADAQARATAALQKNSLRAERVAAAYEEVASRFEHVVLKGFTHVPEFVDDPRVRTQYDLDLYVPAAERERALAALLDLGYEPIAGMDGLAMDHLPTMIRKTGWEWRGDYFDPEIPVAMEIHFQFWDEATDRLRAEGVDQFWTRRGGARLDRVDRLGYAALHLTRHLLRGNVRAFHVWEMARFLDTHQDPGFWREWQALHSPSLRRIEAVAFLLARTWFGCSLSPEARREIAALPEGVRRWFDVHGWSPIEQMFEPNKKELLLHLSLVERGSDRLRILRRRLFPATLPAPIDAVHLPRERMGVWRKIEERARYASYVSSRAAHHLRLAAPTLWTVLRWPLNTIR